MKVWSGLYLYSSLESSGKLHLLNERYLSEMHTSDLRVFLPCFLRFPFYVPSDCTMLLAGPSGNISFTNMRIVYFAAFANNYSSDSSRTCCCQEGSVGPVSYIFEVADGTPN